MADKIILYVPDEKLAALFFMWPKVPSVGMDRISSKPLKVTSSIGNFDFWRTKTGTLCVKYRP